MSNLKKALVSVSVCVMFLFIFAGLAYAEGNKAGIVNGDGVNVRKSPSTSSQVLDKLSKGTQVSILSSSDGWYKVSCNDVNGWINGEFITVKQVASKSGTILANDVNLRSNPSTDAAVITKLDKGIKVSVYSSSDNWYKVKTSGGTTGWIFKDFLSVKNSTSRGSDESTSVTTKTPVVETPAKEEKTATPAAGTPAKEEQKDTATTGQKIVAYAKKFLGVPYVYGASSPKGFDCSGFTKYVFDNFGIDLERVAADQAKHGTKVSKSNLRPGDLVFFDTNGGHNYVNHAAIYIGDGNFIHASSGRSKHKVTISSLDESFYANAYMTARRMF